MNVYGGVWIIILEIRHPAIHDTDILRLFFKQIHLFFQFVRHIFIIVIKKRNIFSLSDFGACFHLDLRTSVVKFDILDMRIIIGFYNSLGVIRGVPVNDDVLIVRVCLFLNACNASMYQFTSIICNSYD